MPKVIRTMLKQDDMPVVGTGSNMLGARIPKEGQQSPCDISPDEAGYVHPDTGGISVARSFKDLLPHLIPIRLKPFAPDAAGKNNRFIWSMGSGEFLEGALAQQLYLRKKPVSLEGKVQGLIEPDTRMSLDDYQSALASTRQEWFVDEPG